MGQPDVASNGGVVAYGDASEDRSIGIDGDVVLDNGVAWHVQHVALFVVLETLGTKGNTLIESDVVADNAGFTDNDTRTMVDGEIFANLCSRMNVDTCLGVGLFGNDARNDGDFQLMQLMGNAVVRHRVHHRVAEDDLAVVRCGRVVVEHRLDISI